MSGLIFLVILSFLVIIHELGHFLFARWSKIRVEEFGLGIPPRAKTLFTDKRGTMYTLNWLPLGGFVRMFGEDPTTSNDFAGRGSFSSAPVSKRIIVVLAGATINFIFGVFAFGVIYTHFGIPTDLGGVKVDSISPGSPAEKSGITVGDLIVDVNGVATKKSQDLIQYVQSHQGESVNLNTSSGKTYQTYVRKTEEIPAGQGAMGVSLTDMEIQHFPWWEMPFRGMWIGLKSAVSFGGMVLSALGNMMGELLVQGKLPAEVSGPVGIVYTAEKEGFLREGFWAQLNFAAILSINLAIVNVLPFPALDGGRAVFLLWELLTRRRVNPKVESWVNTGGFVFLIGLILLISVRDVGHVFADKAVQMWFKGIIK